MNAFNHFASLAVASFSVGYFLPKFIPGMPGLMLAMVLGGIMGLTWKRLTGYTIKKGDKNER